MREKALNWKGNKTGLSGQGKLRIYASTENHSSLDKAIWFSGIGEDNLVRVPVYGAYRSMDPVALSDAIHNDRKKGFIPAGIVGVTWALQLQVI